MSRDLADAWVHREGHLDHLVEGRLVAGGAQRAVVFLAMHRFQRRIGVEDAAAARTQDVPREIEDPEPRGMQESADRLLFVETVRRREIERIDTVERRVADSADEALHRGDRIAV